MSEEAHAFFIQKIERADSLQQEIIKLEKEISGLQSALQKEQREFAAIVIHSETIKADLERARFALEMEKQELERQIKLLKISHRQRREILRKYYPKLTRDQRFSLLFVALFGGVAGLIISLIN